MEKNEGIKRNYTIKHDGEAKPHFNVHIIRLKASASMLMSDFPQSGMSNPYTSNDYFENLFNYKSCHLFLQVSQFTQQGTTLPACAALRVQPLQSFFS